jgi:ubiquinone/menaquinone biosynthesis C-methylase UbiE
MFRNRAYDPLDTLIYKVFKFLPPNDRLFIKRVLHNADAAAPADALSTIYSIVVRHLLDHPFPPAPAHPLHGNGRQDFISNKILAYLCRTQRTSRMPASTTFADIGGGNGDVLCFLQHHIPASQPSQFACIETETDWVETYAHNHRNIQYVFWNNHSIPLPDASRDVVLCMVSLHHMNEPTLAHALAEMKRILKPNGLLLLKEHDAKDARTNAFIEWEHHLYHLLDCAHGLAGEVDAGADPDTLTYLDFHAYLNKCVHRFRPKEWWRQQLTNAGLQHRETTNRFLDGAFLPNDEKNPTQLYWDVFVKRE